MGRDHSKEAELLMPPPPSPPLFFFAFHLSLAIVRPLVCASFHDNFTLSALVSDDMPLTAPTTTVPDVLVLAVASTLLLPSLPYALYRLVPLALPLRYRYQERSPSSLTQDASLTLASTVALAVHAVAALVALAPAGPWTAAVASGGFGCLSVVMREFPCHCCARQGPSDLARWNPTSRPNSMQFSRSYRA